MGQVTQATIDMTKERLGRDEWPNLTKNEYGQLCFAWEELERLRALVADGDGSSAASAASLEVGTADLSAGLGDLVKSAAVRMAAYWDRIQHFPEADENAPLLIRLCEQRDALLWAIKSLDPIKLRWALRDASHVGAPRTGRVPTDGAAPDPATDRHSKPTPDTSERASSRAAVIEECAKVAEAYADNSSRHRGMMPTTLALSIRDSIRALHPTKKADT